MQAITFRRNVLGPDRDGGKPDIRPVPGSEFEVPCRTLIFSIGQSQDTRILPQDVRLAGGHLTTVPNLFVAGDYSSGNADVISAIADGKAAAAEIDEFSHRAGAGGGSSSAWIRPSSTGRLRDHDLVDSPPMPMLPLGQRGRDDEVELGFDRRGRRHPRLALLPVQLQVRDRPGQVHPLRLVHQGFAAELHFAARRPGARRGRRAAAVDRSLGRGPRRDDLHLDRRRPVHPLRQLHQHLSGRRHLATQVRLRGGELPERRGMICPLSLRERVRVRAVALESFDGPLARVFPVLQRPQQQQAGGRNPNGEGKAIGPTEAPGIRGRREMPVFFPPAADLEHVRELLRRHQATRKYA